MLENFKNKFTKEKFDIHVSCNPCRHKILSFISNVCQLVTCVSDFLY